MWKATGGDTWREMWGGSSRPILKEETQVCLGADAWPSPLGWVVPPVLAGPPGTGTLPLVCSEASVLLLASLPCPMHY